MATPYGTNPRRKPAPRRQRITTKISDFLGLNSLGADNKLALGELTEAQNVRFGEGYVEKRPGFTSVADQSSTLTGGVTSMDVFLSRAGVETLMVYIAAEGKLTRVNGTALTTVISSLNTAAITGNGVSYQDNFYFVNGKDGVRKVTSAFVASTAYAGANPTGIVLFIDRLYAWGDATNPQRLYYTATLNGDDWTTVGDAGFIDLPGNIISATVAGSSLIVSSDVENGQIISTYGNLPNYQTIEGKSAATSLKSFTTVKNSVVYLNEHGVKSIGQLPRMPRGFFENDLSRIIRPDFQTLSKGDASAVYDKKEHTWKVALKGTSASAANDTILALDDELGRWSYDVGINTKAWATNKAGTVYFGHLTQAKVYSLLAQDVDVQTNYTDAGTPILTKIATGWINPSGNPNTTHLLRDIRAYFRVNSGTKITIEIEADYDGIKNTHEFTIVAPQGTSTGTIWGASLWGSALWAGSASQDTTFLYKQRKIPSRLWFNFLRIRIKNGDDQQYFRLEGLDIVSIPRPDHHYGRPSGRPSQISDMV